ncbi:MAG: hypothetical protein ACRCTE_13125 [Cellulosilyticaceae bacterium]
MDNLDQLKNKYDEGYRCIYKEKGDTSTWHLKNFKQEKICAVSSNDRMEIGEIDNFLDQISERTKKQGYDTICTEWAID